MTTMESKYYALRAVADQRVAALADALIAHRTQAIASHGNWGYVGDIEAAIMHMEQALYSLGAKVQR